jgi:hypothetical protein
MKVSKVAKQRLQNYLDTLRACLLLVKGKIACQEIEEKCNECQAGRGNWLNIPVELYTYKFLQNKTNKMSLPI